MIRLCALVLAVFVGGGAMLTACGGDEEAVVEIPVDENGFPTDWPVATPPGNVNDCDNGEIIQDDLLFSVVMCLPDEPHPFTASENYLATLERNGFAERDPGSFIVNQETFLDGNGIEIYYQLIGSEATIVLIKTPT